MTSAITRLKLLGDNADQLTRYQADAELREIERKKARADLQRRHDDQQATAARSSTAWHDWTDARADARIVAHMLKGGNIHEPVGAAIGTLNRETRDHVTGEIDKLRGELTAAVSKLQERLARLPIVKTWDANEISYCGMSSLTMAAYGRRDGIRAKSLPIRTGF